MDKFKEIRPIVLGILIKNNKLLVAEKYDTTTKSYFCRCLGGGIEFQENSRYALKREYLEELNVDIEVKNLIEVVENIFEYNGKKAHEIIFMYEIDIDDSQYKEIYKVTDTAGTFEAKWIGIEEFINSNKIIYPKVLLSYLKNVSKM